MPDTPRFDPAALTSVAADAASVRRAFGEPYVANGRTIIPVAKVWSATGLGVGDGEGVVHGHGRRGGGKGEDADPAADAAPAPDGTDRHGRLAGDRRGAGYGGGGGYGVRAKAIGVYVVDDTGVRWHPALDLNRVILGGQAVAAVVAAAAALAWAAGRVARALGGPRRGR